MRYISVCSGIEAASVAWGYLGWEPVAFSEVEPFPCAVLKARYPGVPNLGDLTKIHVQKNGDIHYGTDAFIPDDGRGIDVLVGGTPCFVAGTMVLTPSGYRAIEEIKVGDEIVNADGEIDIVTAVGQKEAQVGELKIHGRTPIVCTPEHPFLTIALKRDYRRTVPTYEKLVPVGEYEFTEAAKSVGRYAGRIKMPTESTGKPANDTGIEDGVLLELAGWYVGDGYIRRYKGKNKKGVTLSLVAEHKIAEFKKLNVKHYAGRDGKVTISNTKLAEWLISNFGEHADRKRIPFWVYGDKDVNRFMHGYEAADGTTLSQGERISTVSKALAYGYADLTGRGSVYKHTPPEKRMLLGREITQKPTYGIIYTEKSQQQKFINDRWVSIIRSWKSHATTRTVYNITVGRKHTYVVEGIAVHNCQDASVAGLRKGLIEGSRSSLAFTYTRLAYELAAYRGLRWICWENVPGVFSLNGGRDFAAFLSSLAGQDVAVPRDGWGSAGVVCNATDGNFGLAYRILDVQYTRVAGFPRAIPQRRRRIFLVGRLGDWERAAEVLFERGGLRGDTPPRRKEGKGASSHAEGCSGLPGGGDEGHPGSGGGRDGGALNPHDSQNERIYGTGGAFHAISANSGGGLSRDGILHDGGMAFFGETGSFAEKRETPVSATLRSSKGSEGPVSETLVVTNSNGGETAPCLTARMTAFGEYDMEDGVASTAKARDFRGATDLIVEKRNG